MKTKSVNRALVVETRNREVAGGSLWAGRLLRQALFSFMGGVIMGGKPYLDRWGKFVLDIMNYSRKLPKDQQELYHDGMMAALKALSEGRDDQVQQAIEILKSEV